MRRIDADALKQLCDDMIQDTWNSKTAPVSWANAYADFKDAIDSMPTLTPPNEWVSVEERLPDKHGEYIVCACDEGEPIDERIWGDTVVVCADYYDGTFTWYEGNTDYDISDIVTHWMYLPKPPTKET